jgi:hypothetical protein
MIETIHTTILLLFHRHFGPAGENSVRVVKTQAERDESETSEEHCPYNFVLRMNSLSTKPGSLMNCPKSESV